MEYQFWWDAFSLCKQNLLTKFISVKYYRFESIHQDIQTTTGWAVTAPGPRRGKISICWRDSTTTVTDSRGRTVTSSQLWYLVNSAIVVLVHIKYTQCTHSALTFYTILISRPRAENAHQVPTSFLVLKIEVRSEEENNPFSLTDNLSFFSVFLHLDVFISALMRDWFSVNHQNQKFAIDDARNL